MRTTGILVFFLAYLFTQQSCITMKSDVKTVSNVDLNKYTGLWYEIASYPATFTKGCHCTTAEYQESDNKKYIEVINRCRRDSITGNPSKIKGKAYPVKNSSNSKLKVQFFWPFRAPYWIIDLADDYSWSVVSGPSKKYLWILSRTPEMEENTYQKILQNLEDRGFDTEKLQLCKQKGCEY